MVRTSGNAPDLGTQGNAEGRMKNVELFPPSPVWFLHSTFILLHSESGGMPWTRTTLSFQRAHCLANRSGSLVRLTFQNGRRGESGLPKSCESVSPQETFASRKAKHSQGCSILSRTGLLFPINHTPACQAVALAKDGRRPGTCIRKARRF